MKTRTWCGLILCAAFMLSGCRTIKQGYVWIYDQISGQPADPAPQPQPPYATYDLTLSVTELSAHRVGFAWEPRAYGWPVKLVNVECDAVVEMRRADGRGGKFDWIRKGGQPIKLLENIHDGYGVWAAVGVPESGERVTFRWVSVDGKKRSNDAEAVWP